MKIGIVVPSVYMRGLDFRKRISAPMELSVSLADGLIEKNIEVLLFSGPNIPTKAKVITSDEDLIDAPLMIDYQQDLSKDAYESVSFYEKKKYFEMSLLSKAFKMAISNEVDLLHIYHSYGNLAHYFTELLDVPTLFTLHVLPPPENTFERWRYKRFSDQNFISISHSQAKGFIDIVPEMNIIENIYHGISTDYFSFNPESQDYMISIGRLIEEKGQDISIKIAKEERLRLKIATHLNSVILESDFYKQKIAENIKDPLIELNDIMVGDEKVKFYQNAKLLLSPIQWEEPFGMVMIESLSCGTPIVAFARGSVPEIIEDGKTGFIVNSSPIDVRGDWIIKKTGIEGIREAVNKIFDMPENEYLRMRKNCRENALQKFTIEKMTDNHIKLYKRILNK